MGKLQKMQEDRMWRLNKALRDVMDELDSGVAFRQVVQAVSAHLGKEKLTQAEMKDLKGLCVSGFPGRLRMP